MAEALWPGSTLTSNELQKSLRPLVATRRATASLAAGSPPASLGRRAARPIGRHADAPRRAGAGRPADKPEPQVSRARTPRAGRAARRLKVGAAEGSVLGAAGPRGWPDRPAARPGRRLPATKRASSLTLAIELAVLGQLLTAAVARSNTLESFRETLSYF